MSELVPCPACKRHVATREIACPFCANPLPVQRAQRIQLLGRVSRAAVFSAALAACSNDKPKQPPPAPAQGTDDLEKLLDQQPHEVEHPAPPIDAAEQIAATPDAAIEPLIAKPDAGIDEAERKRIAAKRKRDAERREAERLQREQRELERVKIDDRIQNAKPYGAPPARRRIV